VRNTHIIPLKTERRSFHGRPRPSLRGFGSGIRSFRTFHSASVRSRALARGMEGLLQGCALLKLVLSLWRFTDTPDEGSARAGRRMRLLWQMFSSG
jgi:hypothetical protein